MVHHDTTATAPATIGTATRLLLGCGVVAGPVYVLLNSVQVVTRPGFDLGRHPLSLLSLGEFGWIQIANFVAAGLLYLAGAVGMRRALASGRAGTWGPRLIGAFGASLVWAGVFVADPADGFPPGTGATAGSWHGVLHNIAPALGFLGLVAACFVFARRFASRKQRGWMAYSIGTGLALLAPDLFFGRPGFTVVLAVAAALGCGWASLISAHLARELGR